MAETRESKELQFRMRSFNREYSEQLLVAFINRNDREVREISQSAVNRNVAFLNEAVGLLGGCDFERAWQSRSERPPETWLARLVLLSYRIELSERVLSQIGPGLPKIPAELEADGAPIEAAWDIAHPNDQVGAKHGWRSDMCALLATLTEANRPSFDGESVEAVVQDALTYYMTSRAAREQESSITFGRPPHTHEDVVKRTWRAIAYADAAWSLNPSSIEARFASARLHRGLGLRTEDARQFVTALRILCPMAYPEELRGEWQRASLEPNHGIRREKTEHEAIARLVPRVLNDIGRVIEVYGLLQQHLARHLSTSCGLSGTGASGTVSALSAAVASVEAHILPGRDIGESGYLDWALEQIDEVTKRWRAVVALRQPSESRRKPGASGAEVPRWVDRLERSIGASFMYQQVAISSLTPEVIQAFEVADWLFRAVDVRDTAPGVVPASLSPHEPESPDAADSQDWRWEVNIRAAMAIHNHGRILGRLGDEPGAVREYLRAIRLDPEFAAAHENLGLALLQMEECVAAERHFAIARTLYGQRDNRRTEYLEANLGEVVVAENKNRESLKRALAKESSIGDEDADADQLVILKRWNSYTPTLPRPQAALGGGYFLVAAGAGIAVDPGYDFIQNLGKAGFSVADISAIAITHMHMDHVADLERLLLLQFERRKRTHAEPRQLVILASEGVALQLRLRLGALLTNPAEWSFLRLVVPPRADDPHGGVTEYRPGSSDESRDMPWTQGKKIARTGRLPIDGVQCVSTTAAHGGPAGSEQPCSGFRFKWKRGGKSVVAGFTGDTRWYEGIVDQFADCDILVGHLGEVYRTDFDSSGELRSAQDKAVRFEERNHLGLAGLYNLVANMKAAERPGVLVIGEYGEELGDNRLRVTQKLNYVFARECIDTLCLTGDIGLRLIEDSDSASPPTKARGKAGARSRSERAFRMCKCHYCGYASWRPVAQMSELHIRLEEAPDGRVVHYCSRHRAEEIIRRESVAGSG